MSLLRNVNLSNFESEVLNAPVPVLVDFYADWCPPCRMMAPLLEQLAAEFQGQVRVVKVNVGHVPALADHFRISGVPTLILFCGGREVDRQVGAASLTQLRDRLGRGVRACGRAA